ncbi:hypothetical protein BJF93_15345 [Xaviernesmea oryzae]|uniref:Uncharacterized protein n=2 Tax=Xaviernesmea oryzae TaxID=464029 RepID=A0A1Q9AY11_9HYPH|nr:hypothetical protein BJF93_15345 [Xaviernesmea oryzae]SEK23013.1 hypothetical protein SAMN04487976_101149 [Xaviernesmea oryzae]
MYPVQELLTEGVTLHYVLMSQSFRRRFAGMAVGKRRDLTVVSPIAQGMIGRMALNLAFSFEGKPAPNGMVQQVIERELLGVSDEDAFATLKRATPEGSAAVTALVDRITAALSETFEIVSTVKPPGPNPMTTHGEPRKADLLPNGWMPCHQISLDDAPRMRWTRTWADGDDFIGFDGAMTIGRIFRIEALEEPAKWLWLLAHPPAQIKLEHPSCGWELTARQAAVRVEYCYRKILLSIHADTHDTMRKGRQW